MDWKDIEAKLPVMDHAQLVEALKTCLQMIERMEAELIEGARKLDEMTALVRQLSQEKPSAKST